MAGRVELTDSEFRVLDLAISNRDSVAFLARLPEGDRVRVIEKAIEVGLFCLERGQNAGDVEFVRRRIDALLGTVEQTVGDIPDRTKQALLEKIGIEDGQVLAPVKTVVNDAMRTTGERIQEVKDLLSNDLDPAKSTTVLGKALSAIRDLLDPQRTDSVQTAIGNAVNQVVQPTGTLAGVVKGTVEEAIRPLRDEVNRLGAQLQGTEMVEQALAETTAKGATYEDEVAVVLQRWAKISGSSVQQVGSDNQPGDFVVVVNEEWSATGPLRIVIEARDRQNAMGRQKITQDLEPKFRERQAQVGIYTSKTQAGLAKEIGDWAEGQCNSGPWIACVGENLLTAVRFAVVQCRLKEMRQSQPEVDAAGIKAQTEAIRTCIRRVRTIKSKVTNIRDTATEIESESDSLRREIEGHLSEIEDSLQKARKPPASIPVDAGAQVASVI